MKAGGSLSIWFFIGLSLAVNGALILGVGVYQLVYPPQAPVVLFNLHAALWWGAVLFFVGVLSCYRCSPSRNL